MVRWLRLLNHFRVSLAVLAVSLAAGWWGRHAIMLWLLAPWAWPWGISAADTLRFDFGPQGPPYVLSVLSVAWLPVVPFLASDFWRLLRPRMNPRATRLRPAFILASAVVALCAVLLLRQHIMSLFQMFPPPTGIEL